MELALTLCLLSIFRKLGLGEARPTTISLQMADKLIKYPWVVNEDVLVKVDKLYLPADFIILDMEEEREVHIIICRPLILSYW